MSEMNDMGPALADLPPDPVAAAALERRREEQAELMRIAAQSALDRSDGGRKLSPEARGWALRHASIKPLGRPLGTGEPA